MLLTDCPPYRGWMKFFFIYFFILPCVRFYYYYYYYVPIPFIKKKKNEDKAKKKNQKTSSMNHLIYSFSIQAHSWYENKFIRSLVLYATNINLKPNPRDIHNIHFTSSIAAIYTLYVYRSCAYKIICDGVYIHK